MWDQIWNNLFVLEGISILEKVLRPMLVYVFLLVGLRLAGKRELAQLNAMDLIVLLMLSNTVQNSIIGRDDSLAGGLIGATSLLFTNYVVVRFLFSHPRADSIVEGQSVNLMEDGRLCRRQMQRELITRSELVAAAHKQGFATLKQVRTATLEPSGIISFVGQDPPLADTRHELLVGHLDQIDQQLSEIRRALAAR